MATLRLLATLVAQFQPPLDLLNPLDKSVETHSSGRVVDPALRERLLDATKSACMLGLCRLDIGDISANRFQNLQHRLGHIGKMSSRLRARKHFWAGQLEARFSILTSEPPHLVDALGVEVVASPVGAFVEERCLVAPGRGVACRHLFERSSEWAWRPAMTDLPFPPRPIRLITAGWDVL